MPTRRASRELALKALYQLEMRGEEEPTHALAAFWAHFDTDPEPDAFARQLVEGVVAGRERIDGLIAESADNWRLPRLSRVDLSLLRLAVFELFGRPEVPAAVTIDEAIEIARRFGSDESAAFVNGVLDQVADRLGVKDRGRGRPGSE